MIRILQHGNKKDRLAELAISTAKALSIKFASVDMIETGDETRVLEVNSGIMMEHFIQAATENYSIAKGIYKEAIHMMLEE